MNDFIQIMTERGFFHQASDLEGLTAKLKSGVQTAYIGYDPTAESLHIGHLMGIMLLKWFQICGHRPITLMGGGTVMAGDPSGKDEMRKMLSREDIAKNIDSIKPVFAQFLTYGDGPTDALMVNNADWLCGLNYIDFLRLIGPHFSINRMLTMDSVRLRLEREQSLSFLEFNYMIMQGYDFVELHKRYGVSIQMGGSDQWGNIIQGVELGRRMNAPDLIGVTTQLLQTSSGAKMGKSVAGAVWLNQDMCSPYEYYQYWRNTEDADVIRWLKIYTMLPLAEIEKLAALKGQDVNEAKKILALEATALCHGREAAEKAAETARVAFEQGGLGGDIPVHKLPDGAVPLTVFLRDIGAAASSSEARRLIESGGVSINDNKVSDPAATLSRDALQGTDQVKLQVGKKKLFKLV